MKRFLLVLFLIVLCLPVEARKEKSLVLTGGVEYTVETARKEAFDGVEYTIPLTLITPHMKDPNYGENKKAMANGQEDLSDRWVGKYSDGGYTVVYKKDRYKVYSYYKNGKLEGIGIRNSLNYPVKVYSYEVSGLLKSVSFLISYEESYAFTTNGNLKSYCKHNRCYDKDGNFKYEKLN